MIYALLHNTQHIKFLNNCILLSQEQVSNVYGKYKCTVFPTHVHIIMTLIIIMKAFNKKASVSSFFLKFPGKPTLSRKTGILL